MSDLKRRLLELKELVDTGLLTSEEFESEKRRLLDRSQELAGRTSAGTPLAGRTVAGPSQIGSYRILEPLGSGAMGTVLRARHVEEGWARRQGGDVALKLIRPELAAAASFRERFLAEAELGMKVEHASVARAFEVVADGASLGIVMELVDGPTLSKRVRPGGLPASEVIALLEPVAEALDHLHAAGIVHRDLKPENIRVRRGGGPVILDLGIAKDTRADAGMTATATTMGSVAWMAPEQIDAKRVGPAADRYALGLIAYALLSGRMPWPEDTSAGRIQVIKLMGQLEPLGLEAFEAAVSSCLATDPSSRPASASAFVDALRAADEAPEPELDTGLEEEPPPPMRAAPPPRRRVVHQPADPDPPKARRKVLLGVAAGVATLLALWGGASLWGSALDEGACGAAAEVDDVASWQAYLEAWPEGRCAGRAEARIDALEAGRFLERQLQGSADDRSLAEVAEENRKAVEGLDLEWFAEQQRDAAEARAGAEEEDEFADVAARVAAETARRAADSTLRLGDFTPRYDQFVALQDEPILESDHVLGLYLLNLGEGLNPIVPMILRRDGTATVAPCGRLDGQWKKVGARVELFDLFGSHRGVNRRVESIAFKQDGEELSLVAGDFGERCLPEPDPMFEWEVLFRHIAGPQVMPLVLATPDFEAEY